MNVFVLRITISLQNIKVWFANDLDSVSEIIIANRLLLIINNFTNKQIKFSKIIRWFDVRVLYPYFTKNANELHFYYHLLFSMILCKQRAI